MNDEHRVAVQYVEGNGDFSISNRAARMVRWLCENVREVNTTGKGEIRFCFAGKSLSVHTTNVDDKI